MAVTTDFTAAIDAEIERVDELIADLRTQIEQHEAYVASLIELQGQVPGGPNGAGPTPKPTPRPAEPKQKPRQSRKPKRTNGSRDPVANRQAIRDLIADANQEGTTTKALAEASGMDRVTVSKHCDALVGEGLVTKKPRTPRAGGTLWRLAVQSDEDPPPQNGAKTIAEHKVVDTLRAAPVALTTIEVAANTKLQVRDAVRILGALAKRGVINQLPSGENSYSPRWEVADAA